MLDPTVEGDFKAVSEQKSMLSQTSKSEIETFDSKAEGDLRNDFDDIERQGQQARDPEEDSTDLLTPAS